MTALEFHHCCPFWQTMSDRDGDSASAISSPAEIPVGTYVKLDHLRNAAHLNGRAGRVIQAPVAENGRYAVELLLEAKQVSLQRENLHVMDISVDNGSVEERTITCLGCRHNFAAERLLRCSKCRMARYCSKECQVQHWKAEHRDDCALLRAARKAKDDDEKLPTDQADRAYARQERALRYVEQGNHLAAAAEFRALLEKEHFRTAATYFNLGTSLCDLGRTREAKEMYQKATECDGVSFPDMERTARSRAFSALADMLKSEQNFAEAEDAYRRALDLDSSDAYSWKKLASVMKAKGDFAGYVDAMQNAQHASSAASRSDSSGNEVETLMETYGD